MTQQNDIKLNSLYTIEVPYSYNHTIDANKDSKLNKNVDDSSELDYFDARTQKIETLQVQQKPSCCSIVEGNILLLSLTIMLGGCIVYYWYTATSSTKSAIEYPFLFPVFALGIYYMFFLYSVSTHVYKVRTYKSTLETTSQKNNITSHPLYLSDTINRCNIIDNTTMGVEPAPLKIKNHEQAMNVAPTSTSVANVNAGSANAGNTNTFVNNGCLVYNPHEAVISLNPSSACMPVVTTTTVSTYIDTLRSSTPELLLNAKITYKNQKQSKEKENSGDAHLEMHSMVSSNIKNSQNSQIVSVPIKIRKFSSSPLSICGAEFEKKLEKEQKLKTSILYIHSFDIPEAERSGLQLLEKTMRSTIKAQLENSISTESESESKDEDSNDSSEATVEVYWSYSPRKLVDHALVDNSNIDNSNLNTSANSIVSNHFVYKRNISSSETKAEEDNVLSESSTNILSIFFNHYTMLFSVTFGLFYFFMIFWNLFHHTMYYYEVKRLHIAWKDSMERIQMSLIPISSNDSTINNIESII